MAERILPLRVLWVFMWCMCVTVSVKETFAADAMNKVSVVSEFHTERQNPIGHKPRIVIAIIVTKPLDGFPFGEGDGGVHSKPPAVKVYRKHRGVYLTL